MIHRIGRYFSCTLPYKNTFRYSVFNLSHLLLTNFYSHFQLSSITNIGIYALYSNTPYHSLSFFHSSSNYYFFRLFCPERFYNLLTCQLLPISNKLPTLLYIAHYSPSVCKSSQIMFYFDEKSCKIYIKMSFPSQNQSNCILWIAYITFKNNMLFDIISLHFINI